MFISWLRLVSMPTSESGTSHAPCRLGGRLVEWKVTAVRTMLLCKCKWISTEVKVFSVERGQRLTPKPRISLWIRKRSTTPRRSLFTSPREGFYPHDLKLQPVPGSKARSYCFGDYVVQPMHQPPQSVDVLSLASMIGMGLWRWSMNCRGRTRSCKSFATNVKREKFDSEQRIDNRTKWIFSMQRISI